MRHIHCAFDAVLDIVIPYAKERIQFGSPLSEKQGYTHKLFVPHAVRREAASAYIDEIALRLDRTQEDLQVEGSIAKFFATEAAVKAANEAVLLHGGRGYSNEYPVERYYRDIKGLQIYEGTAHIQKLVIARELLGRE